MNTYLDKMTLIELLEVKRRLNEEHEELSKQCTEWDTAADILYKELRSRGYYIDSDGVIDVELSGDDDILNKVVKH